MSNLIVLVSVGLSLIGSTQCIHPVILVPGDGGSRLLAKLDKHTRSHVFCAKKTDDYYTLWLDFTQLSPFVVDCFVDNSRLYYNNVTRKTTNTIGVDIKVPGFGNTTTIEYLDPDKIVPSGKYFSSMVSFMDAKGLKRGFNIRGAPYDFRKAPNEHEEFFVNLKRLAEETYTNNGNKSLILIGHSLGCPMLLYFLNHQTQAWKDKYVKSLVTLSAPFAGSVKSLLIAISGYNFRTILLNPLKIRPAQRSQPSLAFLLPFQDYWNTSEVLVKTPEKKYTVSDYKELFNDIGWKTGYDMWLDTKDLISIKNPPGVEIHCLHGAEVKTIKMLSYDEDFPDSSPTKTYESGDGTVNLRSLEACTEWSKYQEKKVYHKIFPGVDHTKILKDPNTFDYIFNLIKDE